MSEVRGFTCLGRTLVETCVNDLRTVVNGVTMIDADAGESVHHPRREAVIILYASGLVSVYEGWNVKHDDVPELLAAKVLRDG